MKKLGHIIIALSGMVTVWLGNSFIAADFNPFHLSVDGRISMVMFYLCIQVVAQMIYCGVTYS